MPRCGALLRQSQIVFKQAWAPKCNKFLAQRTSMLLEVNYTVQYHYRKTPVDVKDYDAVAADLS
jgi:hypothetical protein